MVFEGLRVNHNWQRQGIARKLTQLRIKWLEKRSESIYVFLSDENKETLPMYKGFNFSELSRGWEFVNPKILKTGVLLSR